ncbi:FadR/GntR family transcriptional regulator [Nesterenkonia aerolata]|uniref:GntR family transcriptional regulator n=1 Tax=Nesterenkonia aerolata TaxID=3074079 RepID=A0ABU2DTS9_9MICC|nr:GntR family transcriptional regulator [Nesterenkonia sp. LY-0111]MDR8019907.1 GntR family transcriptional regulator [Nesterenkonia sp. LY-0111]
MTSDRLSQELGMLAAVNLKIDERLTSIDMINRSAATTDAIKSYILREGLQPGDALPTEATLCKDLGVSRSSVREALRKLEALDIVEVKQGRGSFVGQMSLTPLVQTLVLRSSLQQASNQKSLAEVVKVRLYLDLGLADEITATMAGTKNPDLRELVQGMEAKARAGERFLEEDIAFHNGLLDRVEGTLVQQMTSSMWLVHMAVIPDLDPAGEDGLLRTAAAHGAMLQAAEDGDAEAYRAAVRDHYAHLQELLEG